jgi:pimeloyl-ACP methyl ester carboxylesterase
VRREPLAFVQANAQLRLYPLVAGERRTRDAFFSADIDPALLSGYAARIQDESYLAFLDMVLFRRPRPARVRTRVLVLGAANDAIFSPQEMHATAAAYGTTAEIVPGMAHDMMLERGWQSVADRMLAWLDGQGL